MHALHSREHSLLPPFLKKGRRHSIIHDVQYHVARGLFFRPMHVKPFLSKEIKLVFLDKLLPCMKTLIGGKSRIHFFSPQCLSSVSFRSQLLHLDFHSCFLQIRQMQHTINLYVISRTPRGCHRSHRGDGHNDVQPSSIME